MERDFLDRLGRHFSQLPDLETVRTVRIDGFEKRTSVLKQGWTWQDFQVIQEDYTGAPVRSHTRKVKKGGQQVGTSGHNSGGIALKGWLRLMGLDQALARAVGGSFSPVGRASLVENVRYVITDRLDANNQLFGDLPVRFAGCDPLQHLHLSPG